MQRCEFEQPCEQKQRRLMLAVEVEPTRLIDGGLTLQTSGLATIASARSCIATSSSSFDQTGPGAAGP